MLSTLFAHLTRAGARLKNTTKKAITTDGTLYYREDVGIYIEMTNSGIHFSFMGMEYERDKQDPFFLIEDGLLIEESGQYKVTFNKNRSLDKDAKYLGRIQRLTAHWQEVYGQARPFDTGIPGQSS
jgi:hypothetical protein